MKYLFSFILISLFYLPSFAQFEQNIQSFEAAIQPGTHLFYDVNYKGHEYQFVVTIKELSPELVLYWEMRAVGKMLGTIYVTVDALENADALFNYFSQDELRLEEETAIQFSKKLFQSIKNRQTTSIRVNGIKDEPTEMMPIQSKYFLKINEERITVPIWELTNTEKQYSIELMDSEHFPMIINMDLGWTIRLNHISVN